MISSNRCVSVVVPVYFEEEVLPQLYERLKKVLEGLADDFIYEIVFVNDGSTDNSIEIMKELASFDSQVRIVDLARNFGHQIAVSAGLRYVTGDCVVIMDADLQDPPELIPAMVSKWLGGFEVVYGVRKNRNDPFLKKNLASFYYRILSKASEVNLPLDTGDFCLMDHRVVSELISLKEARPYVRGLRSWVGFRQTGIEFDRPERAAGAPKYNLIKSLRLGIDGMMSFTDLPLKSAGMLGIAIASVSLLLGIGTMFYSLLQTLGVINGYNFSRLDALLTFAIVMLVGLLFIYLGLLGQYLGRIFIEVKRRPLFVVRDAIGFDKRTNPLEKK
jgi:dolichol-phosphate mannosyltransferase